LLTWPDSQRGFHKGIIMSTYVFTLLTWSNQDNLHFYIGIMVTPCILTRDFWGSWLFSGVSDRRWAGGARGFITRFYQRSRWRERARRAVAQFLEWNSTGAHLSSCPPDYALSVCLSVSVASCVILYERTYLMYVKYYLSLTACSSGTKVLDRGEYKEFKYCAHCKKIMVWRKSWERNWNEVKFCRFMCVRILVPACVYEETNDE